MRRILLGIVFALFATPASAQHEMMVTAEADRISIGPEFVPRCTDLANVLHVNQGSVVTAAADSTWDCVEVFGTLRIARDHDTVLHATHIFIMPGGVLDVGTSADPNPRHVEIVLRDVPLNTARDPFQWGNGLLNFGHQFRVGSFVTPFASMVSAPSGVSTIQLLQDVSGWKVGDELVPTDTKLVIAPGKPRRESRVFIAAIAGRTITLSKALDFEHQAVTAPDGRLGVNPVVANLTRNIVVRSENPMGTPGHTANIGDNACWDIQSNLVLGLGRTTSVPIDDTSADLSHIGTNPKARYADHDHHAAHGTLGCQSIDNVYRGIGPARWGHVTHGTHDTKVAQNIAIDFPGSGFVTEDGYEVRNEIVDNLALYNLTVTGASTQPTTNIGTGQPGTEGTGFWLHGIMQTFDRNHAWNNQVGVVLLDAFGKVGMYPSQPGGPLDVRFDPVLDYLPANGSYLSFSDNVSTGNTVFGLDVWGVKRGAVPIDRFLAVANYVGVDLQASGDQYGWYRNLTVIGGTDTGNGTAIPFGDLYIKGHCLKANTAYIPVLIVEGGYLGGCGTAVFSGGKTLTSITGVTLQGILDMNFFDDTPVTTTLTNTVFLPFGLHPPRFVLMPKGVLWTGVGPNPLTGVTPPPPPPPTCQDPKATNLGGPLPCVFPPSPPVLEWRGAVPVFQQEFINGVATGKFRVCFGGSCFLFN